MRRKRSIVFPPPVNASGTVIIGKRPQDYRIISISMLVTTIIASAAKPTLIIYDGALNVVAAYQAGVLPSNTGVQFSWLTGLGYQFAPVGGDTWGSGIAADTVVTTEMTMGLSWVDADVTEAVGPIIMLIEEFEP